MTEPARSSTKRWHDATAKFFIAMSVFGPWVSGAAWVAVLLWQWVGRGA